MNRWVSANHLTQFDIGKTTILSFGSRCISLSNIARISLFCLILMPPHARGSVQPWAVTMIHLFVLAAFTFTLLSASAQWKWQWIRTPMDAPILGMLIWTLISALFSHHFVTSLDGFALLVNYVLVYYLVFYCIQSRAEFRSIVYVIVGTAALLAAAGFFRMAGWLPESWWLYPDIARGDARMRSAFGNPNHLAGYMEMAILLTMGLLLTRIRMVKKGLLLSASLLMLSALFATGSRGGFIGLTAGICWMGISYPFSGAGRWKRVWIGLMTIVVLMLILIAGMNQSLSTLSGGREGVWRVAVDMAAAHPVTGIGPGTFELLFPMFQPPDLVGRYRFAHNDYLHIIAETGIPVIAIMLWFCATFFRGVSKKIRRSRSRQTRGLTMGASAGVVAILVHGLFDFNLHIPANALVFAILTGIAISPVSMRTISSEKRIRGTENLTGKVPFARGVFQKF